MTEQSFDDNAADEAIVAYLAGDDAVVEAARKIWLHSARLAAATKARRSARRDLEAAATSYSAAILACRIPEKQVRRLGAVLMMHLGRQWLLAERDNPAPGPNNTP